MHALNCARTGGRVVGVAVDEAALGLDAYGERRARQRVATATADGALRLWPAPQSAVSEADAKLIEVAANGDEALSMVSAALLKGGDLYQLCVRLGYGTLRCRPEPQRAVDDTIIIHKTELRHGNLHEMRVRRPF